MDPFIEAAFEYVYPGQWEEFQPGFAASVVAKGVGFLFIYNEGCLTFGGGVLTRFRLTLDVVRAIGELNKKMPIGALYLTEGQPDQWQVIFSHKYLMDWIDPECEASARMLGGLLRALPDVLAGRAEDLQREVGGDRWKPLPGWELALIGHL